MMKRLIACLLCLLLSLSALSALGEAAAEETERKLPVFTLYHEQDGERVMTGTAVLFTTQQILLTTTEAMPYHTGMVAVCGEEEFRLTEGMVVDRLVLVSMEQESALEPMVLSPNMTTLCVGAQQDGTPVAVQPDEVQGSIYRRMPAQELTLTEGLMPGAVLTDGLGVTGLVLGRWGEGVGRYQALSADALLKLLNDGLSAQQNLPAWVSGMVTIRQEGCVLIVDWSEVDLTDAPEGSKVWLFDMIPGNCFYQSASFDLDKTSGDILVSPGQVYNIWVYVGPEEPDLIHSFDASFVRFATQEGERYTEHQYKDEAIYLTASDANVMIDNGEETAPLTEITPDVLNTTANLWLQVTSTYQVEEMIDLDGCVNLLTPEGFVFTDDLAFTLDPSIGGHDVWSFPVNSMIAAYRKFVSDVWVQGEYRLNYYLGDQLVSEISFMLK